jgi:hypothetical protein
MDRNPYESPREAGYETPEQQSWRLWARDRIALIAAAVLICIAIFGSELFYLLVIR